MRSSVKAVLWLVMLAALVAAGVLVKRVQETRRGAFFAEAALSVWPSEKEIMPDGKFSMVVKLNPAGKQATGVNLVMGYNKQVLEVESVVLNQSAFVFTAPFDEMIKQEGGNGVITLTGALNKSTETGTYPTGVFDVATVVFRGVGKTGDSTITLNSVSEVVGINVGSTDVNLKVNYKPVTYKVRVPASGNTPTVTVKPTSTVTVKPALPLLKCGWCGTSCVNKKPGQMCPDVMPPYGMRCVNVEGKCTAMGGEECDYDVNPPAGCKYQQIKCIKAPCCPILVCPTNTPTVTATPKLTATPRPTAKATPKPTDAPGESENDMVLNFKVGYLSMDVNGACTDGWPLTIIAMGGGSSQVYTNVVPERDTSVTDRAVFQKSLLLEGFKVSDKVAIFVKGSKHIQTKYGINNQTDFYNKAGGELKLTDSAETSPWYDFSGYPLWAGDVRSNDGEGQDGVVNGSDFSYVKEMAESHETWNAGESRMADLDGNCQYNSSDVNIIRWTLREKLEMLY